MPITPPDAVAAIVDRGGQGAAVLGPADAGRPGALPGAGRPGADRRVRRDPGSDRARAGQAAQRGLLDGDPAHHRRPALDRPRRRRAPLRREDPDAAGVPEDQALGLHLRAARGDRDHLALELSVEHPVRRGRAGADGGQRRGVEARIADSAGRRADRPGVRAGGGAGGPRARDPRPRHRSGAGARPAWPRSSSPARSRPAAASARPAPSA